MALNNDCRFEGRMVRTPELRRSNGDKAFTSFSLAVQREYTNAQNEWLTDYIDFVAFGKQAERICEKCRQGDLIKVAGTLQIQKYTDKQDNKRTAAQIVVNEWRKAYMPKKASDAHDEDAYPQAEGDDYSFDPGDEPLPF